MFAKIFKAAFVASALVSGVVARPFGTSRTSELAARGFSFNNWGGFNSLSHFDDFFGSDNFSGRSSSQTIIIEQSEQLVCNSREIQIVQQRLLILQEIAKRVILEQICEVEVQTIIFEQFHSSFGSFSDDLQRHNGRRAGFDRGISSHFNNIFGSDGSLNSDNFGFSGHDLGKQIVIPGGSNWDDNRSPSNVQKALDDSRNASNSSNNSSSSSPNPAND